MTSFFCVFLLPVCYGLNMSPTPNSYIEVLTPNMWYLDGDGAFGVIRFRWGHEGEALMMRLVSL